ncbi:hypothetical protein H0B56_09055 [Haloechinothrix sp. YIM 98757]|uniref:Transmembrane protein n=1 Tax=Haloechinothrix aidingensis TaxID=2752311 RepID=A0A838A8I1_9PSEU|nr:hypothetical protein [Haloechinothrix aidingensis]MBA0125685.1 hypothetical protein [Haloechinothrix aidingensis]
MLNEPRDGDPDEVAELREEIEQVERSAARTVELGRRGFGIAVLVFVLIVAVLLPWVDGDPGWRALAGESGIVPRLFATTTVVFGIVISALTLVVRRWWMAWVCAIGGWVMFVDGLLAIWSQQSTAAPGVAGNGPGVGMVLALITAVILAINWMRVAGSRQ